MSGEHRCRVEDGASFFKRVAELEARGAEAAIVTVVRANGSTPREAGAKMIVHADGSIEGTIGGGRVEQEAIEAAKVVIAEQSTRFMEMKLTQELGMCCGGQVALFIEPIERAPRLLIFGAGHVGMALSRVAAQAGFNVHVADERGDLLSSYRFPDAAATYDNLDDERLPFGAGTFVMVTTHDHALDQRLVEKALKKPRKWLGLIGSRRKSEVTRQRLSQKGFSEQEIAALRCPVGLAIGAGTPAEIAISILSELILVRRGLPVPASDVLASPKLESKVR